MGEGPDGGVGAFMLDHPPLSGPSLWVIAAVSYSPTHVCSTISAVRLSFRVRNGDRAFP